MRLGWPARLLPCSPCLPAAHRHVQPSAPGLLDGALPLLLPTLQGVRHTHSETLCMLSDPPALEQAATSAPQAWCCRSLMMSSAALGTGSQARRLRRALHAVGPLPLLVLLAPLQGVKHAGSAALYMLSDPAICSEQGGRHGATDIGAAALKTFWSEHKCGAACRAARCRPQPLCAGSRLLG